MCVCVCVCVCVYVRVYDVCVSQCSQFQYKYVVGLTVI